MSDLSFCANPDCGDPSENLKQCTACRTVAYCSPECQRIHWPIHKSQCKLAAARRREDEEKRRLAEEQQQQQQSYQAEAERPSQEEPESSRYEQEQAEAAAVEQQQKLAQNNNNNNNNNLYARSLESLPSAGSIPSTPVVVEQQKPVSDLDAKLAAQGCGGCGTTSKELHACSACKSVAYCSRECQRGDWTAHKHLCKALAAERQEQLARQEQQQEAAAAVVVATTEEEDKPADEEPQEAEQQPQQQQQQQVEVEEEQNQEQNQEQQESGEDRAVSPLSEDGETNVQQNQEEEPAVSSSAQQEQNQEESYRDEEEQEQILEARPVDPEIAPLIDDASNNNNNNNFDEEQNREEEQEQEVDQKQEQQEQTAEQNQEANNDTSDVQHSSIPPTYEHQVGETEDGEPIMGRDREIHFDAQPQTQESEEEESKSQEQQQQDEEPRNSYFEQQEENVSNYNNNNANEYRGQEYQEENQQQEQQYQYQEQEQRNDDESDQQPQQQQEESDGEREVAAAERDDQSDNASEEENEEEEMKTTNNKASNKVLSQISSKIDDIIEFLASQAEEKRNASNNNNNSESEAQKEAASEILTNVSGGLAAVLQYQRHSTAELELHTRELKKTEEFSTESRQRMEDLVRENENLTKEVQRLRCRLFPANTSTTDEEGNVIAAPAVKKVRFFAELGAVKFMLPGTLDQYVGVLKQAALERAVKQGFLPPSVQDWDDWYLSLQDGTVLFDDDILEDVGADAGEVFKIYKQGGGVVITEQVAPKMAPPPPAIIQKPSAESSSSLALSPKLQQQQQQQQQRSTAATTSVGAAAATSSFSSPLSPNGLRQYVSPIQQAELRKQQDALDHASSLESDLQARLQLATMVLPAEESERLASNESIERRLNIEMRRMELEAFEAEERAARKALRLRRIQTVRARLMDKCTYGSSELDRRAAREAYAKLNAIVEGMNSGTVSTREVEMALLNSEVVLSREPVAPTEEENQRVAELLRAEELSVKDRVKLVVDIKDMCDIIKFKLQIVPEKWKESEDLIRRATTIASMVPIPASLTLSGMLDELGAFIRNNSRPVR